MTIRRKGVLFELHASSRHKNCFEVTHNCFTSKHEASFIITLDSVEGTKEIKLPSTIDFKDLTHYSFTRV